MVHLSLRCSMHSSRCLGCTSRAACSASLWVPRLAPSHAQFLLLLLLLLFWLAALCAAASINGSLRACTSATRACVLGLPPAADIRVAASPTLP